MKSSYDHKLALGIALTLAAAGSVHAASHTDREIIDLDQFDAGSIEGVWSATQMNDLEVRGTDGDAIGEVESIIVGADDNVAAIVLEVGGLLDIGDTHVRVPWEDVVVDTGGELGYLTVPVTEDNLDRFDLYSKGEVDTVGREWRTTELIGDYASTSGSGALVDYGYVKDLLFNADGTLESVVVNRNSAYGGGYQAYPYYGYDYGYDPGLDTYELQYGEDDLVDYEPFDYSPYTL